MPYLRMLEREHDVDVWPTTHIDPGSEWRDEINHAVKKSDIAILLVSPSFMASEFIRDCELPMLLRQRQKDNLLVCPILLYPTSWFNVPWLAELHFLNNPDRPLSELSESEVERALSDAVHSIGSIAGARREREAAERERNSSSQTNESPESSRKGRKEGEIFLSHSKVDADFAELLKLRLEKAGYSAWIDTDRLDPGIDWREGIDDAIRNCFKMIAIMSPDARESEYVTYEWAFAWGLKKPIIPLMLRETPMHPRLAILQYIDFSNRPARPWSRLFEVIKKGPSK